tara:strand:- start:226 stop:456 length:231 start_codon:yes stop_codon:yes gene_type:complete
MPKNDLTPEQIDDLKDLYVERYVDNMDNKDLYNYVFDDMERYVKKLSDNEFLNEAENYWDDYFDEIIEEIKEDSNA